MTTLHTRAGKAHPFGATVTPEGVNFSLYSQEATEVVLLLFESPTATEPMQEIRLDPFCNKTFHLWHVLVVGLKAGALYAFRVDGPNEPSEGLRFNPNKVLISPMARGVSKQLWKRSEALGPGDNVATSMRCAVVDTSAYDWEGDTPLRRPIHESVIYEMHVRGFTRAPSSGVQHPGTFAGIVERIPYLQSLGVTAVELLPVCEFDDSPNTLGPSGEALCNYWGYSSVAFFSPHSGYTIAGDGVCSITEFRDMVKALHRAGIEVILDVVFNHTDEGNELGPTESFRGIDNRSFYLLDADDPARYSNYSGVGNTFNANHPIAHRLIVDCLRYWVEEMHVDGFRFDEGSILTRGEDGEPLRHPPVIWEIELSDALADTKMIVEAWDAAGLYQVGHFPGDRWAEWNGRFRDEVRRFVKGDPGLTGAVAWRIGGSADIYRSRGQTPENTINFVTVHDGFTLNDLFSYSQKHNDANGEGNRDGIDENWSWNCGVEGPSTDQNVDALRARLIKNCLTILFLSRGVPMLLAGDEIRRTQRGNNNAYNQDNPTSWLDWNGTHAHAGLLRFVQRLVAFRHGHPALQQPHFYTGAIDDRGVVDLSWHGTKLGSPGFDDPSGRALACTIGGMNGPGPRMPRSSDLHVMMNMYWEPLTFEVPTIRGQQWHFAIDTAAASPNDIVDAADDGHGTPSGTASKLLDGHRCTVGPRSIIVLSSDRRIVSP